MKENWKMSWCGDGARAFPFVATALAVASCFAEPLLEKYFAPGRSLRLAIALVQAVPIGLLARYVIQSRPLAKRFTLKGDAAR